MRHEVPGSSDVDRVIEQQRRWAHRNGVAVAPTRDGLADWSDALMVGELDPRTRAERERGAGKELRRLHHLWSSACLAVNVFEPWRDPPESLGAILGGGASVQSLVFESVQPTGLRGISPHLDVLLEGAGPTVGIECKFLEMYSASTDEFEPSHFNTPGL